MAYNSYINSFATSGDYETYINGSTAKAPNVGYLKDSGVVKYATMLPNDYVVFGITTGTTDFTSRNIQFKVEQATEGDNILYVEASGVPQSLTSLYECFSNTEGKKVTKIAKWVIDTSNVMSLQFMFAGCSNLTSLDLSSFDTSNVTNMSAMFNGCSNLTSLDLSSFDTSKVTDMNNMFNNCSHLTSLDLSSFDTSNVTSMNSMLGSCQLLNKLYISSSFFNTASITDFIIFKYLNAWTDADSIEQLVQAAENVDGSGRTISLSNNTLNAMTQAQKDRITSAGWTLQ